ncbi:hypothetical protein COOONC_27055 [Cooperia oncophora]
MKERESRRSPEKIPVTSNFRLRRGDSLGSPAPAPLRRIPQEPSYGEDSSERGRSMVEDKYKETERKIDEAIRHYTPEYFKKRMSLSPTLPLWKCELLARKLSSEKIQKVQEEAWVWFLF